MKNIKESSTSNVRYLTRNSSWHKVAPVMLLPTHTSPGLREHWRKLCLVASADADRGTSAHLSVAILQKAKSGVASFAVTYLFDACSRVD